MALSVRQRSACSTGRKANNAVATTPRAVRPFTAVRPAAASSVTSKLFTAAPSTSAVVPRAAATESAPSKAASGNKEFYAIVCNSEFFFNDPQNESIAEQLRERVRFFKEQNREIDFWLVPDPLWLDKKFPDLAKQVKRPCVALVSHDKQWITFMKLRIDRVARCDLGAVPAEEALAVGGKVPDFKPPAKWTAPYAPYTPGWWNAFIPKH